jgi:hypothetical protein
LPVIYSSARITSDLLLADLGIAPPATDNGRMPLPAVCGEETAAAV